jgi:ATP-dependent RNA helicase DOB1
MTVSWKKKNPKNPVKESTVIIDVLLHTSKDSKEGSPIPCREEEEGEVEVIPILHTSVCQISSLRIYYPKDLRPSDNRKAVLKTIQEVKRRFPEGLPLLNPIADMRIEDQAFKVIVKRIETLENLLRRHPLYEVRDKYNLIST